MVAFGKLDQDRYNLTLEVEEKARTALLRTLKDGLPEEAHRADVLCYLLDEAKGWIEAQRINL